MISSTPNLILYACISKGSTILAEFFSSGQSEELQSLAQKCIEKAPPFHSIFSQTVSKRTYKFLIQDPHVYFAIFDENVDRLESLRFLNRLKSSLEVILGSGSVVGSDSHCLQSRFDPIFRKVAAGIDLGSELETPAPSEEARDGGSSSSVSSAAMAVSPEKLLSLKKKKKKKMSVGGDAAEEMDDVGCRDLGVSAQKGGSFYSAQDRRKAKQVWRKHVWVVLALDFIICSGLFGIWLWVCRGFHCIHG